MRRAGYFADIFEGKPTLSKMLFQISKLRKKEIDQFFDSWRMKQLRIIENYAKFLKQPLKLEMFVPCDEEGDILEEPEDYEQRLPNMMTEYNDEIYRYEQAKEKVLFEGFEIDKNLYLEII